MKTNEVTTPRRSLMYGGSQWLLPFRVTARYVDDAHGRTVLEAEPAVAKELCKYLNALGAQQAPIRAV